MDIGEEERIIDVEEIRLVPAPDEIPIAPSRETVEPAPAQK
jgi:hypothetical protein